MAIEENIEPISNVSNVPPQEAAENINDAKELGVDPDAYQEMKETLKPQLESSRVPPTASRIIRKSMGNSIQEASVIKPSLEGLNSLEKQFRFVSDSLTGASINRTIRDLNYELAQGRKLTLDQEIDLGVAEKARRELVGATDLDYNWAETVPGELAGVTSDFLQAVEEGKWITAGGAVVFGTIGAGVGFLALGPPGAIAGGISGISTGAVLATTLVSLVKDTFVQSVGGIYEELGNTKLGKDLSPEAENERRSLAKGGGFLMTVVNTLAFGGIASKVPFLKKIINPKSIVKLLGTDLNKKWKRLAIKLGQSALFIGAVEEGSQEFIQIVTKNMAEVETAEDKDTSFILGMFNTLSDWETVPRVSKAALIGAIADKAFTVIGKPVGAGVGFVQQKAIDIPLKKIKEQAELRVQEDVVITSEFNPDLPTDLIGDTKNLSPDQQGINALKLADSFEQIAMTMQDTEYNQLLPENAATIMRQMADDAGVSNLWFERSELIEWAGDDVGKIEDIEKILGVSQVDASDLNAPIMVEISKVIQLIQKYPKSLAQFAKLEPEAPTAKQYIDRVTARKVDDSKVTQEDAFNEPTYLEARTFEESAREEVKIQLDEVRREDAELRKAKGKVTDTINDDPTTHKIVDYETQVRNEAETEARREVVESDKNINTVESFLDNSKVFGPLTEDQQKRVDKKKPAYSINLKTLPDNLYNKYVDDVVLKKRKVFNKTGMSASQVANIFGFDSVDTFLDVMSSSPTKKQHAKNLKERAKTDPDVVESNLNKAFKAVSTAYVRKSNSIIKKFKDVVTRVAPNLSEIRTKVRDTVGNSKLKNLNPNQWALGHRRSYANFKSELEAGRYDSALDQQEKAITNNELIRLTHLLTFKVNKAFKFIAQLNSIKVREALGEGKAVYINAINSLMDFYNLQKIEDVEVKVNAYNKFVEKMKREGRGDFRIDDETMKGMQPEEFIMDMTVDQILYIDKLLRNIIKEASLDNTLLSDTLGVENTTIEIIADQAMEIASKHLDFNQDKLVKEANVGARKWMVNGLRTTDAFFTNMRFILLKLDSGKKDGFFSKQILRPMIEADRMKTKLQGAYRLKFDEGVAVYNKAVSSRVRKVILKSSFKNLGVERVFIPEASEIPGLSKGALTKLDLVMLHANMGNGGNKKAVLNFKGLDIDTVRNILKRELTVHEFDFVQHAIWDNLETLKEPLAKVEKETNPDGDLEFIEAESFEEFGKTFRGGYLPLRYKFDAEIDALMNEQKADEDLKDLSKTGSLFPTKAYLGVMRAPHVEERIGSKWELDLDINSFVQSGEDIIHDITMRKAVRDVMGLLRNKRMSDAIISVVGKADFHILVNGIAEQTNSLGSRNMRLYNGMQKFSSDLIGNFQSAFAITVISMNPSSPVMSLLTIPQIVKQMGVNNARKYLTSAVLQLYNPTTFFSNRASLRDAHALGNSIDPTLDKFRLGVDERDTSSIANSIPKKREFAGQVPGYNYAKVMQERWADISIGKFLGGIDNIYKKSVALAGYNQYRGGDAPGTSMNDLLKMTPEEIHSNAMDYAEALSSTSTMRAASLDKAFIQKGPLGRLLSMFWNEPRNVVLGLREDIRETRRSSRDMVEALRDGDIEAANLAMYGTVGDAGKILMTSLVALAIINIASGRDMFDDSGGEEDLPLFEDLKRGPKWALKKVTSIDGLADLAVGSLFGNMIVISNVVFGQKTGTGARIPIVSAVKQAEKTAFQTIPFLLDAILNDLTLLETLEELKPSEIKDALSSVSFLSGGFGVSGPLKIERFKTRYLEGEETDFIGTSLDIVIGTISKFIGKHDETLEEQISRIERERETKKKEPKSTMQQTVDHLKELKDKLVGSLDFDPIEDDDMGAMKYALSNNDWRHTTDTSGRFGVYQIDKTQWADLVDSPEGKKAGLTVRGRVSQDGTQQEKAIKIINKQNAEILRGTGVDVNLETIYFAHRFGPENAAAVYNVSDKTRISQVLTPKVLKENPGVVTGNVKTAGDMKKFIKNALNKGREAFEKAGGRL